MWSSPRVSSRSSPGCPARENPAWCTMCWKPRRAGASSRRSRLYERQGLHEGAEAEVDAISGLGVATDHGAERLVYSRRATVGTATEIATTWRCCFHAGGAPAWNAVRKDAAQPAEWVCPQLRQPEPPLAHPRHLPSSTYAAACLKCNGVGSLQVPNPAKLIIHPEKPLTDGAMYSPGFFPNGYLGKPFNGGYYLLQALASITASTRKDALERDDARSPAGLPVRQQRAADGDHHSRDRADATPTRRNSPAFTALSAIGM